jgi:hypothetical protein
MPVTRDACYMGHETYDMNQCHFIWYGIHMAYISWHIGDVHIYAYVCHMTHDIKGWKKSYSNKPTYHLSTRSLN